jgi:hypothetical protein
MSVIRLQRSTAETNAELDWVPLHAAVAAADLRLATVVLRLDKSGQFGMRESLRLQQDSSGRIHLHVCAELPTYAASSNVLELWELLLDDCTKSASKLALQKQDCSGRTVLHVLIQRQQLSMLRSFLKTCNTLGCLTALLAVEDVQGVNAVLLAQRIGDEQILTLLSEYCSGVRDLFIQSYFYAVAASACVASQVFRESLLKWRVGAEVAVSRLRYSPALSVTVVRQAVLAQHELTAALAARCIASLYRQQLQ